MHNKVMVYRSRFLLCIYLSSVFARARMCTGWPKKTGTLFCMP